MAAIYAGRLAHGEDVVEVARAARFAPFGPEPLPHAQLLLRGLAVRLTDGYLAAAPTLKEALRRYRAQPQQLDWLCVSYNLVAMDLWDDDAWFELAAGQVRLARANGTLSWLPFALDYLAESHIQAGELSQAAALLMEGDGLGDYGLAAEAAHSASAVDEVVISPWALYEFVEAAVRSDQRERASAAADRLSAIAAASASDWARGAAARSRALLSEGRAAEDLHREAIELLSRTRVATHLARARLSYGEWLRRENRRVDARDQLRPAFEAFASMGAQAFGERARRELQATGERVRKRNENTRAELTPDPIEADHRRQTLQGRLGRLDLDREPW